MKRSMLLRIQLTGAEARTQAFDIGAVGHASNLFLVKLFLQPVEDLVFEQQVVNQPQLGCTARQERTLLLIAALELVGWGVAHWDWLWPAILPTSLPFWVDRLVASTTLVGALGAAAAVIVAAAAPERSFSLRGSGNHLSKSFSALARSFTAASSCA